MRDAVSIDEDEKIQSDASPDEDIPSLSFAITQVRNTRSIQKLTDISDLDMQNLRKAGKIPVQTCVGVMLVGDHLSPDDIEWFVRLIDKHKAVFERKKPLGIIGTDRKIRLKPGYQLRRPRFKIYLTLSW